MKLDLVLCGPRDLVRRLQALFERVALPVWAAVRSKATTPPSSICKGWEGFSSVCWLKTPESTGHTKHHQPPLQQTPALPQFASVASADVSVYTQISKVRSLVSWIFSHQKIKIPWKMPECLLWAPSTLQQQPECGGVRHRQLITHCRLTCWAQNLVHTLTACASMPVQSFCLGHNTITKL
jgi:hypothetical protein